MYFITAQNIIEKVSIYKTKPLLKLEEETKVLENLESGHLCQKGGIYLMKIFVMCLKMLFPQRIYQTGINLYC